MITRISLARRACERYGTLPCSQCVARLPAHVLWPEGTGPLTGNVGWAQQISRHVTAAGSI